jgi:hypothetical protein
VRQAGPAFGGMQYLPFICANVASSIMKSIYAAGWNIQSNHRAIRL